MAAYLVLMQHVDDIDRYRAEYLLRFADAASAWGLLNDPEYQPVKEIRFGITSRGQAVVAPEFVPAG